MKDIVLIPIMATSSVTQGPESRIIEGGKMALQAVNWCIEDDRNLQEGFVLIKHLDNGVVEAKCQILATEQGDYYAAKGIFIENSPMLNALIDILKK